MGTDYFWKKAEESLRRYGITLITAILANVGALLGILTYFNVTGWGPLGVTLSAVFTGGAIAYICVATYRVYSENKKLKKCALDFHQINHHYRDILFEMFSQVESHGDFSDADLLAKEKEVLAQVCQKIANIFISLTKSKCMVSVSLLESENGENWCFVWARSEFDINRNQRPVIKFKVSTENTKYYEALQHRPGSPAHFFGPDLIAIEGEGNYYDQNPQWKKLYRSCIVVPIRHYSTGRPAVNGTPGTPPVNDVLGFLRVDTMDIYRLNDDVHVQFLAAFADQMYNFLCLMRGRYARNLRQTARPGAVTPVAENEN